MTGPQPFTEDEREAMEQAWERDFTRSKGKRPYEKGFRAGLAYRPEKPKGRPYRVDCECVKFCGDSDPEGPGTCKDLPLPPEQPLVEVVLIDRRTGEAIKR